MSTPQINVLISLILLALYGLSIGYIGFFISTVLYLIVHMMFLGVRDVKSLVLVSAGAALVFYTAFEVLLRVSLPRGLLF